MNINMIKGSKNTTFSKSNFYAERDFYYYLILDSDIQKIQFILPTKRMAEFGLRKGVMEQVHITEQHMNNLYHLYGIALKQNVEQTVH